MTYYVPTSLKFLRTDNTYSAHNKYVPYLPRANLPSCNYRKRHKAPKMGGKSTILRRTLFVMFLLSFAPYFLPEDDKPAAYRPKTKKELDLKKRDKFIGGQIDKLTFK